MVDYETGLQGFDAYELDSFARGWDSACKVLGNKKCVVRPPLPGASLAYDEGKCAAITSATVFANVNRNSGVTD